jgi:pimeloyl-ACP methyl ester carboxylesterase
MTRHDVEFTSDGTTLRGHLYLPEGDGPFPAVVMAGGWLYVKELLQPTFAEVFAAGGFAALVFDNRNLGESDGEPRQHIDPSQQFADYRSAISYLETRDEIATDRIGIWGVSYSGGHVLVVGATDPRVKAIVSIVPVVDGWRAMRLAHGTYGMRALEETVLADRRRRDATGEYGYMPMSSPTAWKEVSTWPFADTNKVFAMLQSTDAPNHRHENTIASVEHLFGYDIGSSPERLVDTPTLMLVADHDDHTHWDDEIHTFNRIATPVKSLQVMTGTSHMGLYEFKDKARDAARLALAWYAEHL